MSRKFQQPIMVDDEMSVRWKALAKALGTSQSEVARRGLDLMWEQHKTAAEKKV